MMPRFGSVPAKHMNGSTRAMNLLSCGQMPNLVGGRHFRCLKATSSDSTVSMPKKTSTSAGKPLKVAIFGATGRTGRLVIKKLTGAESSGAEPSGAEPQEFSVTACVRSKENAQRSLPAQVDIVAPIDIYNYQTLEKCVKDADVCVVASGWSVAQRNKDLLDPLGPFKYDFVGVKNIVAACQKTGSVKRVVLVSSVGVEDLLAPLNAIGGIMFWKKRGEESLQQSGIDYSIIRPGRLTDGGRGCKRRKNEANAEDDSKSSAKPSRGEGQVVFTGPGGTKSGKISREKLADIVVGAISLPAAANTVVECVTVTDAIERSVEELYEMEKSI